MLGLIIKEILRVYCSDFPISKIHGKNLKFTLFTERLVGLEKDSNILNQLVEIYKRYQFLYFFQKVDAILHYRFVF